MPEARLLRLVRPLLLLQAQGLSHISRQSARIHITQVWTQLQGMTHHWREYTSVDANPHVDAGFQCPSRACSKFRICCGRWGFKYFLYTLHYVSGCFLELNRQVDARFHKHSVETHISAAAAHIKPSRSPTRRSIPQAPTRDTHQWHHSTSKAAIPNLDDKPFPI